MEIEDVKSFLEDEDFVTENVSRFASFDQRAVINLLKENNYEIMEVDDYLGEVGVTVVAKTPPEVDYPGVVELNFNVGIEFSVYDDASPGVGEFSSFSVGTSKQFIDKINSAVDEV